MTEWVNGVEENDGRRNCNEWLKHAENWDFWAKLGILKRSKSRKFYCFIRIKSALLEAGEKKIKTVKRENARAPVNSDQKIPTLLLGWSGTPYFPKHSTCEFEIPYSPN